jgi:hypothetical protein
VARIDLYSTVHKGLRAELCQVATLAGRTDFGKAEEADEAALAAKRLVEHLETHAALEDREVMPELARVAPELHAELSSQHALTAGLQRDVAGVAEWIRRANGPNRVSLGRRLHQRLWWLVAEHLRHMEREETEAMRTLWAYRTDEDLAAIQQRMVGSIPRPAMAEWGAVLLAALSLPERTALLEPLVEHLPGDALEAFVGPVRSALGERWAETAAAVGL